MLSFDAPFWFLLMSYFVWIVIFEFLEFSDSNANSGEVLDAIEKMKEELMNAFQEEISSLKNEVKGLWKSKS